MDGLSAGDEVLGPLPMGALNQHAGLITVGLLWGSSFMESVGLTIAGGRDTDSNGATVGSVYGALHGASAVPAELVGTTHVRVRSALRDFDRVRVDEFAERTIRLADDHLEH